MIAISSTGNKTHLIYCPLKIGVFSILNIHPMAKQKKKYSDHLLPDENLG
jgi:hypothetical protein